MNHFPRYYHLIYVSHATGMNSEKVWTFLFASVCGFALLRRRKNVDDSDFVSDLVSFAFAFAFAFAFDQVNCTIAVLFVVFF